MAKEACDIIDVNMELYIHSPWNGKMARKYVHLVIKKQHLNHSVSRRLDCQRSCYANELHTSSNQVVQDCVTQRLVSETTD